jgi:hypothetical protein
LLLDCFFFGGVPFAYVGGLGPESIPYFLSLVGLVGAAGLAILQWPILSLLRWIKGRKGQPPEFPRPENPPMPLRKEVDDKP